MRSAMFLVVVLLVVVAAVVVGALLRQWPLASAGPQREVEVFAGAAAAPVYRELARVFESRYGVKVVLHIAGSGALLTALEVTRRGDVYIPGSPEFLLLAHQKGVVNITEAEPKILAYMVPAIIVQRGNPKGIASLEDLARPGIRVGIGDPKTVCVGRYAKELLELSGLWEEVSKNIAVYAPSCEAVAQLVYTGSVDAVIGWHVFYYWNPNLSDIVWIEPERVHKIGYIAGAVTTFARDRALAQLFLDFLASPEAGAVWARYGYFPTLEDARRHAPNAVIERLES